MNCGRHENVDLIVMGTHGRTGFSRALLGSATEEISARLRAGPHRGALCFAIHGAPASDEGDSLRHGLFGGISRGVAVRGFLGAGAFRT